MSNLVASRFANSPVMVGLDRGQWLSECLMNVTGQVEQIEARQAESAAVMYDDFWPSSDSWMARYRPYEVVNNTLLIPIKGVLLHDFGYQLCDWATGYIYIQKAFERGMADPAVQRIAMVINSGGGEVAGCFDAVDRVYAMRGQKPVVALVNEHAYSAAFAWASVADQIIMPRTGGVGSVGVVTSHWNMEKALADNGYEITLIFAGDHKVDGNPYERLPEAVKNRMQARIDGLYDIFVSTTARNLSLDEQAVRDTQALTYSADQAVAVGFAHEVRAFDEALAAFSGGLDSTAGDEQMSQETQNQPAEQATQAALDAARAEGRTEGAQTERERIQGILASDEAKTRPALANHLALNTSMSAADAKGILAASQEEAKPEQAATTPGADFAAAMSKDNPELAPESATHEPGSSEETLAMFRQVTGFGGK